MLGTLTHLISTLIGIYMVLVIAWAVISTLIGFNIINRYQPLTQRVMRFLDMLVQPAIRPIQRIMPDLGGIDLSPIILIVLLSFLQQFVYSIIDVNYALFALITLISTLLVMYMYCVGVYAVLSLLINFGLVNPHQALVHIVMNVLRRLVHPLVVRLRHVVPPIGRVDLAPWILLALLMVTNHAVLALRTL